MMNIIIQYLIKMYKYDIYCNVEYIYIIDKNL